MSQKDLSSSIKIDIANTNFYLFEEKDFTEVIFAHKKKKKFSLSNKTITIKKAGKVAKARKRVKKTKNTTKQSSQ